MLPFGFAGGLYDASTGFLRFGAREYSPMVGRFLTKDPLNFGAGPTNLYSYANFDPINGIDPSGMDVTVTLSPGISGSGHITVSVNGGPNVGYGPRDPLDLNIVSALLGSSVPGSWEQSTASLTIVDQVVIATTPAQEELLSMMIQQLIPNGKSSSSGSWNLYGTNCARQANTLLNAIGQGALSDPTTPQGLIDALKGQ